MRPARLLTICLVAALLAAPAIPAMAAHRAKPRCSVPRGWRLVAKDRQAVVIRQRRKIDPRFDYCNRSVGQLRQLGAITPSQLRLAGRYVAIWAVEPATSSVLIKLWDTRSSQHNALSLGGAVLPSPVPTFLLSPDGVAAAIVLRQPNGGEGSPGASVQALTLDAQYENLDGASSPSEIANLQLYDCAAGCASRRTVVAWTNGGVQHYAQITP